MLGLRFQLIFLHLVDDEEDSIADHCSSVWARDKGGGEVVVAR
jgi:hypothetical protein